MFKSDKNIYIQETEVKPNRYATIALLFTLVGILFCWVLNEIGLFRVGAREMRLGSSASLFAVMVPLVILLAKKSSAADSSMKYVVIVSTSLFTLATTTLLTFHSTMMLLFPIFIGMLYRSRRLGFIAMSCSMGCTIVSPILGYVLGTWDIELFKELILIGTNGTAVIEGAYEAITIISILKIVLYIVLPRLIIVGSCAILMFYIISLGMDHVNNQLMLNNYSHRDALTGLYNRTYLNEVLENKSFSGKCAVLFFDVNDLKQVNDRLGHEGGDLLLCKCAECLLGVCNEEYAGAFRWGGDEFMMISFRTDEAEIKALLAKLNENLREVNKLPELISDGIVCSMAEGYAIGDFSDAEELIRTADGIMYENKKAMKEAR